MKKKFSSLFPNKEMLRSALLVSNVIVSPAFKETVVDKFLKGCVTLIFTKSTTTPIFAKLLLAKMAVPFFTI